MLPACILKGLNACKRGCNVGFHFCRVFIPPSQTEDHNDNLKLFSSAFSFPYHYIPHTHTHYTHRYIGAYIRIKESNSCSWEIHTHIAFFSQVYFSRVLREVNWLNVEWKVDMWFGTDNIGLWDFHHYEIMPKTEARKTRQRFVGRAKRTSPLISTDLWHCFTWFCIVTDDPGLAQGDHFHLVPCLWVTLSLSPLPLTTTFQTFLVQSYSTTALAFLTLTSFWLCVISACVCSNITFLDTCI